MCHLMTELEGGVEAAGDPAVLLPLVQKKQWELLTTDSAFVQAMYEGKVLFSGVVVLILDAEKQVEGVGRLFERHHRLTPQEVVYGDGDKGEGEAVAGGGAGVRICGSEHFLIEHEIGEGAALWIGGVREGGVDSGDVGFGAVLAEFEFAFDTGDGDLEADDGGEEMLVVSGGDVGFPGVWAGAFEEGDGFLNNIGES